MNEPPEHGDRSFDALYRDCARDLYAYVRTLLGDDASAEDVTALAFERAYRRRDSFDEQAAAAGAAGCSASPATPRSTSCAAAAGRRR